MRRWRPTATSRSSFRNCVLRSELRSGLYCGVARSSWAWALNDFCCCGGCIESDAHCARPNRTQRQSPLLPRNSGSGNSDGSPPSTGLSSASTLLRPCTIQRIIDRKAWSTFRKFCPKLHRRSIALLLDSVVGLRPRPIIGQARAELARRGGIEVGIDTPVVPQARQQAYFSIIWVEKREDMLGHETSGAAP
jgi:hypothetical protein